MLYNNHIRAGALTSDLPPHYQRDKQDERSYQMSVYRCCKTLSVPEHNNIVLSIIQHKKVKLAHTRLPSVGFRS